MKKVNVNYDMIDYLIDEECLTPGEIWERFGVPVKRSTFIRRVQEHRATGNCSKMMALAEVDYVGDGQYWWITDNGRPSRRKERL